LLTPFAWPLRFSRVFGRPFSTLSPIEGGKVQRSPTLPAAAFFRRWQRFYDVLSFFDRVVEHYIEVKSL
jgi:hypothetical protein